MSLALEIGKKGLISALERPFVSWDRGRFVRFDRRRQQYLGSDCLCRARGRRSTRRDSTRAKTRGLKNGEKDLQIAIGAATGGGSFAAASASKRFRMADPRPQLHSLSGA